MGLTQVTLNPGTGGSLIEVYAIGANNYPVSMIVDQAGANIAAVTPSGALKVDASATTQPVSNAGTFIVQATLGAGSALAGKVGIDQTTPGTTNAVAIPDAAPAATTITAADTGTTTTAANGAPGQFIVTGAPTAGSFAVFALSGASSAVIQALANLATLVFEKSYDGGTTYVEGSAFAVGTAAAAVSGTVGNGVWTMGASGATHVRVRCTSLLGAPAITIHGGGGAAWRPGGVEPVADIALTSGGWTYARYYSLSTVNTKTRIKAAPGRVRRVVVSNTNASPRWLNLYDVSHIPIIGSDTPAMTVLIPGNTAGVSISVQLDAAFLTGIGFTINGGVGDSDTTQISANEVILNFLYQ